MKNMNKKHPTSAGDVQLLHKTEINRQARGFLHIISHENVPQVGSKMGQDGEASTSTSNQPEKMQTWRTSRRKNLSLEA
jgi:carbamate kinase